MKGIRGSTSPCEGAGKATVNRSIPNRQAVSENTDWAGTGVSSIPLADEGMKDFQKEIAKISPDFAVVKDKGKSSSIYSLFSRQKMQMPSQRILQSYSARKLSQEAFRRRPVFWRNLKNSRRLWLTIPKKVAEKKKERSR